MSVSIESIRAEDIVAFRMAVDSVAREGRFLASYEAPSLEAVERFVHTNLEHGYPQIVALADGALVGWCDITPEGRPLKRHVGLLGMGVVAAWRGRGVGNALLNEALTRAAQAGFLRIELSVRADNAAAMALYRKHGFVQEGIKRFAVRVPDGFEDVVIMARLSPALA
ncbi:GNAT family protein [Niveibacterium umoris]|uniref:Ribosomal protein S18 acetylase RimI-like enzyme n=1 Tax=Niveibacterium umoris TaxID=1193620 RepID=A0A840BQQ2_9RHOO|nr:GNAT family N-acetyltransferase [Niveibacterium umoris]MBB4014002.1 ribosomal protein S18 acetylase RimI-like enzyme [Niveibacterium umoris]